MAILTLKADTLYLACSPELGVVTYGHCQDEALNNLERDHEFLLQGDVFTQDVISTWIWYKREKEVDAIRLRPHPYEFALYYDI